MSNIAEFIRIREQIESDAKQISTLVVEKSTAPQSKLILDQATGLLANLTDMADNDIQVIAVGRLTRLLNTLRKKVEATETKKRPSKKLHVAG